MASFHDTALIAKLSIADYLPYPGEQAVTFDPPPPPKKNTALFLKLDVTLEGKFYMGARIICEFSKCPS